jgi:hypothetical protein
MAVLPCAQCHRPLPARRSRGPAASYCSRSCRQAAYRQRRREHAHLEPLGLAAQTIVPALAPANVDSQVQQAILDGRGVAGCFIRLGREARVEFAWRCAKTGEAMLDAMDRYFPEVR